MEKPTKQIVYLLVKVEDELPELQNNDIKHNVFALDDGYKFVAETIRINGKLQDEDDYPTYATHWLKSQEAFVFTPEQLNEYTANVIQQTLETAAEKAMIDRKPTGEGESSEEYTGKSFEGDLGYEDYIPVEYTINTDSIINTEEETFKKFEV